MAMTMTVNGMSTLNGADYSMSIGIKTGIGIAYSATIKNTSN